MFIKATKFKRLIKEAYKGGRLHVGNDGVNFLAAGAGWSLAMREELMPKELKAAVIEYVGHMPEPYEYFLALEDGDQAEVAGAFIGIEETAELPFAEATRLAYVRGKLMFNIFQSVKEEYDFMVSAPLVDMIDESVIEEADGELRIRGPYLDRRGNQIVVENDRMQLRLFISRMEDAELGLLDYLSAADLNSFAEETS